MTQKIDLTGQKCVEYNILGTIIQESIIDCNNATVPCPEVYRSTEAFKCKTILTNDLHFVI